MRSCPSDPEVGRGGFKKGEEDALDSAYDGWDGGG